MISAHLLATLDAYLQRFPAENDALRPLRRAIESGRSLTSRRDLPGHITSSGVLLNGDRTLLIHHSAFAAWIQPGGHLETTDSSLRAAALRELCEELVLTAAGLAPALHWPADLPLDVQGFASPSCLSQTRVGEA